MKSKIIGSILVLALAVVATYFYVKPDFSSKEPIHIAYVGPMPGAESGNARPMVQAIQLYFDKVNSSGGVNGRMLQLDLFDDNNEKDLAAQRSLEIARDSNAVAVIGHNYSSTSMAGGENYRQYGVPAISPTATSVDVTHDNPWYFRTVPNDTTQGKFLTHYIKRVLGQDTITIVQHTDVYGEYLAKVVAETAANIGLTVTTHYIVDTEAPDADAELDRIASEIKANPESGAIFLGMYEVKGADFVRILKDKEINNDIVAPDAFAGSFFVNQFKSLPREIQEPGFYTNGIYITSPLIFDTASEKTQSFVHDYQKRYQTKPDWTGAESYDAALLITEAIRKTGVTGEPDRLAADRKRIRDYLEGINSLAMAVDGASGKNYFNEQGDAVKPMNIGVYQRGGSVSSLVQLQVVENPRILDPAEAAKLIQFDQFVLTKTNVVYTGIRVNEISKMDFGTLTFDMDFNIWFRHRPGVDPSDIFFANAVEPITLGDPIKTEIKNGLEYSLYRAKGTFRADYLPSFDVKKHTLSLTFRHQTLSRSNLIYVVDSLGMGMDDPGMVLDGFKKNQVLNPVYDWAIDDVLAYQDVEKSDSLGDTDALYRKDGFIRYSRYNYKMLVKEQEFDLFEFVSLEFMLILFGAFAGTTLILSVLRARSGKEKFNRSVWACRGATAFLLMVCLNKLVIDWMVGRFDQYYVRLAMTAFEMLWWIIPVWIIIMGIETFGWEPLERKTGKAVPSLIKRITAFVILMFAAFGILAFVFDQRITSLLATSGAIAMIIGLAIQVNIANVFSGIILNIDNKIKIGDWIMVHGRVPSPENSVIGCVVDIGWRTTQLRTTDNSLIMYPNSAFADKTYTNFMLPEERSRFELVFCLPYSVPTEKGLEIINKAAMAVAGAPQGPMAEPKKPKARVSGTADKGVLYKLRYWLVPRLVSPSKARNTVINSVLAHLKEAGVSVAYPTSIIHSSKAKLRRYDERVPDMDDDLFDGDDS